MDNGLRVLLAEETELPESAIDSLWVNPDPWYKRYSIPRGSKMRQIEEPVDPLKAVQSAYLKYLNEFPLMPCCMAVAGKGVTDNAEMHRGAQHMLKVDIKGCYQAVRPWHVIQPLEAVNERAASAVDLGFLFDKSHINRMLPTGAPTSPMMCNIALTPIDAIMTDLVAETPYTYTRYLDDMIFSSHGEERWSELFDKVLDILDTYSFKVNTKKSGWRRRDRDSMNVTGVSVGNHKTVTRKYQRTVRAKLHRLATEGLPIDQETRGCLAFIQSIDQHTYHKLLTFYNEKKK